LHRSQASDFNETITETVVSGLTTFFAPGCVLDWDRFAVIIPPGFGGTGNSACSDGLRTTGVKMVGNGVGHDNKGPGE